MAEEEAIRRKARPVSGRDAPYFWDICPELAARWKEAMLGLPPSVLHDLAGQLDELEAITNQTNQELRATAVRLLRRGHTTGEEKREHASEQRFHTSRPVV
jgi:hypothetical protein